MTTKYTNSLLIVFALTLMTFTSCASSQNCADEVLENTFNDAFMEVGSAINSFSGDPSDVADCERVLDAYKEFISELESIQDCADDAGQGQEWRELINEARDELNDVSCG